MDDYEHQELERKIDRLKEQVDNLDYELRRLSQDLEAQISRKANKQHSHDE